MRFPHVAEARRAMGTRFEVVLPGEPSASLRAAAEEVLDGVERLEAQLSRYRESSEISGLNACAAAGPVRVEPRLFALLRLALDVARRTGGAFDPTIGPLLHAWGFTAGSGRLPDPEAVEAALAVTGAGLVELDEEALTARFLANGVALDLGAIGKGCALDRAREALDDAGAGSALLHGGTSTVYGRGPGPDGPGGWRVALRDPEGEEGEALAEVLLGDLALSVSAPHGKSFTHAGRRYGHVLDPRTGRPTGCRPGYRPGCPLGGTRGGALLAAVAHPSATLTDALSTALLVLGAEGPEVLVAEYPDADFLVVLSGEGGESRLLAGGPGRWQLRLHRPAPGVARRPVLEIVDAQPPSRLTAEDGRRVEPELEADRGSWDR